MDCLNIEICGFSDCATQCLEARNPPVSTLSSCPYNPPVSFQPKNPLSSSQAWEGLLGNTASPFSALLYLLIPGLRMWLPLKTSHQEGSRRLDSGLGNQVVYEPVLGTSHLPLKLISCLFLKREMWELQRGLLHRLVLLCSSCLCFSGFWESVILAKS